jgi:LuxR family transcriptional regulator, maltose regulon positive regulatory protein
MMGSLELFEAMPKHETAHAALLSTILDVMRGSYIASNNEPDPHRD